MHAARKVKSGNLLAVPTTALANASLEKSAIKHIEETT